MFRVIPAETEVVGRQAELEAIDLTLAGKAPRALVLEGPAGIGKTTLWRAGIKRATELGYLVCRASPAATETSLLLAGLRDLLSDVPHEALDELPPEQQHAIAIALLEDESNDSPGQPGRLGVAVLGLLETLAAAQPLLVAVDDLQWLDEASAATLVYALRRTADSQVRLLVSCRGEPGAPLPCDLHQVLGQRALVRVAVGPLSEGAIRRLVRLALGLSLTRIQSHAVYAACEGNPFFALELARAGIELDETGSLRIPADLRELVAVRLKALPALTREALLAVAALAEPTLPVIARAGLRDGIPAALDADVLELDRERIRFTHPLLAATVWATTDDEKRHAVHRLLAGAVGNREQRARHLALAVEPPDAYVAGLLEEAAADARRRGAPGAAGDLLDEALRFTPAELDRWPRLAALAAAAHAAAGHSASVEELVEEARRRLPSGPERAAVLVAVAETGPGMAPLLEQASKEAGETALGARALIGLAAQAGLAGRWIEAVHAAERAAAVARRIGDRGMLGVALTYVGGLKLMDSRLDGLVEVDEALALERQLGGLPTTVFESPRMWQSQALLWSGDPDGCRIITDQLLHEATQRGDDLSSLQLRQVLSLADVRAGDLCAARGVCRAALEQAEMLGYDFGRPVVNSALSVVAACAGELEEARAVARDAVHVLEPAGERLWSTFARGALLLTELCDGDYDAALEHASAIAGRFPERECWWSFHQGDELEALVLAGEHERARERAAELRRAGVELGLPRFLAWAGRGDGLMLAATGELDAARAALEAAVAEHERFVLPFERARTLLAYGQVLRRQARRREARAALGEALRSFDEQGARHFAAAVREELKHVGGHPPAGEHELTQAEAQIAQLVAAGLSNRKVAAELYLAVGTVESALTRIYRKLGLTSRSQLACALAERDRRL